MLFFHYRDSHYIFSAVHLASVTAYQFQSLLGQKTWKGLAGMIIKFMQRSASATCFSLRMDPIILEYCVNTQT